MINKNLLLSALSDVTENKNAQEFYCIAQCPKCQQHSLKVYRDRIFYCIECCYSGGWEKLWQDINEFSSVLLNIEKKTFFINPPDKNFIGRARAAKERYKENLYFPHFFLLTPQALPFNMKIGWYNNWWVFPCEPFGSAIIIPDKIVANNNFDIFRYKKYQYYKSAEPEPEIYVPDPVAIRALPRIFVTFSIADAAALYQSGWASAAIVSPASIFPGAEFWKNNLSGKIVFLAFSEQEYSRAETIIKNYRLSYVNIVEMESHPYTAFASGGVEEVDEMMKKAR